VLQDVHDGDAGAPDDRLPAPLTGFDGDAVEVVHKWRPGLVRRYAIRGRGFSGPRPPASVGAARGTEMTRTGGAPHPPSGCPPRPRGTVHASGGRARGIRA